MVKVNLVPRWAVMSPTDVNALMESKSEADLPQHLDQKFYVNLHGEFEAFRYILKHKHLPVFGNDFFGGISFQKDDMYDLLQSVFPEGLPDSLSKFSWEQKKYLVYADAGYCAVYTKVIPLIYSDSKAKVDPGQFNKEQTEEYNSLYNIEVASKKINAEEVILLSSPLKWYGDVLRCFPNLRLERVVFPKALTPELIEVFSNKTNTEWKARPQPNCAYLASGITPNDIRFDEGLLPYPHQLTIWKVRRYQSQLDY